MPATKNALIRYRTIDKCLSNQARRWTLDDLIEECRDALYESEGVANVSRRTIQGDIQMMRSDRLGYNAPIEVYDNKYYRYADPEYSITKRPLTESDLGLMRQAVDMLRQLQHFDQFAKISDVVNRMEDELAITAEARKPIIHFDSVPDLKGLRLLNPLYQAIERRQVLRVSYQSFKARQPVVWQVYPHLLKEYRNRWFLFCTKSEGGQLHNLALDRMVGFSVVEGAEYRDNPAFDSEHFFDDVIGVTKDITAKAITVTFRASRHQTQYIITKPVHRSQKLIERCDDGSTVFQIEVVHNVELESALLSYGAGITVLSPPQLVEQMVKNHRTALEFYDQAAAQQNF